MGHVLYFLLAAAYTAGPSLQIQWFVYLKVIPLLIAIGLVLRKGRREGLGLVMTAILLGIGGDLVLEHCTDEWFAVGAGLFLVNHIFYNIYFLSLWHNKEGTVLFRRRFIALAISVLFLSASSVNLVTSFSDQAKQESGILVYLLPVYMVVLDFTAIKPLLLLLSESEYHPASIYLFLGGACYFLSDNLLGMTKFAGFALFGSRRMSSIGIMTTYYLAQYFITLSLTKRNGLVEGDTLEKSLLSE